MRRIARTCLLAFSLMVITPALSEQQPFIVSEGVQKFALEYDLGERLGIDWSEASAEDIARYMHYITAIDIIAQERAKATKLGHPTYDDYRAAAWSLCSFPIPFKPPEVREHRWAILGSYTAHSKRVAIEQAIGPGLLIEQFSDIGVLLGLDVTYEEYRDLIFNFEMVE